MLVAKPISSLVHSISTCQGVKTNLEYHALVCLHAEDAILPQIDIKKT